MRILIIEDQKQLNQVMKQGLERSGFSVDSALTGAEASELAFVNQYDAVLLDLNLPDQDGIDLLKEWRSQGFDFPVIIVSARDQLEQKTLGLDLGADDYISKPFQLAELESRLHAVIRRFHGRTNPIITIGSLTLDPMKRVAYFQEKVLTLATKEFDILFYLAEAYPAVVSSEELMEHIYDDSFNPFSSVLRVHMTRLRKKIFDCSHTDLLKTIRGKGYYLCEEPNTK